MQVIVSHTFCPTIGDSTDWVAAELGQALKSRGHATEDMLLPFDPGSSPLEQILAFRLFEPIEYGDGMITLHPPCHVTCHRGKVIWGVDPVFRNEDLMPPGYFRADSASQSVLESLRVSDRLGYAEARRVCLRSRAACESHLRENQSPAVFLPLPPRRLEAGTGYENVVAARTAAAKPALLLTVLEALVSSPPPLRLLLFGPLPFSSAEWSELLSFHRLEGRVDLMRDCAWPEVLPSILAVLDLSCDPDCLGQNTIDAHGCEKPIVAFESPAASEWIEDGHHGLIVPLAPLALGSALISLASSRDRAAKLGLAGKARLDSWGANWHHAVETLTEL